MSSQIPFHDADELDETLYRHGLSLAVLFDLLVDKGITTPQEISCRAKAVKRKLLSSANSQPEEC